VLSLGVDANAAAKTILAETATETVDGVGGVSDSDGDGDGDDGYDGETATETVGIDGTAQL
jgi:hypothetical protein